MEYLLTLEVREDEDGREDCSPDIKEAYADALLVFGKDDFGSGTLVSTVLQTLIPGLLGEVYQGLDKKQRPEAYKEVE